MHFDTKEKDFSTEAGVIGLGNTGGPMAANIAKAGHSATGFDMAQK